MRFEGFIVPRIPFDSQDSQAANRVQLDAARQRLEPRSWSLKCWQLEERKRRGEEEEGRGIGSRDPGVPWPIGVEH